MKSKVRVISIEVENLRGYSYTKLRLDRVTILIGENNQGKSSLLKMLNRLVNFNDVDWASDRVLSDEGYKFWYPANSQNHKARRFSIKLSITDGRLARRFNSTSNSEIPLRFAVRSVDGECRLNLGVPKRGEVHDPKAVELLEILRSSVNLILIPPLRDAGSSTFAEKATRLVREKIRSKLTHRRQAGAPKEYRIAREVAQLLKDMVDLNKEGVRSGGGSPLAEMMLSSEVRLDIQPLDILRIFDGALRLYVSTGEHDESMVQPHEVGNGLQSLIDMDLSLSHSVTGISGKETITIIEEPEAFIHPSAQRHFMRYLRNMIGSRVGRAIITTHSPIIVDEARFEEVVIVRDQRHFQPDQADEVRSSINTALMSVANSEVFFARTVVLVEGEGDRALINTILRRVAAKNGNDRDINGIVVQPTGSCKSFSPWLKLIDSFRNRDIGAFELLWIMDGDAASRELDRAALQCISDSGRRLDDVQRGHVISFGDHDWRSVTRTPLSVDRANLALQAVGGRLFSCDLEWAIFNNADKIAVDAVRLALRRCGVSHEGTPVQLAQRLGSKIETGRSNGGAKKKPYIRAAIGEALPLKRLPEEIEGVIRRILMVATGKKKRVDEIMGAAVD